MHRQLKLWGDTLTQVDLTAKIKAEREEGKKVFYHFRGEPLPMHGTQQI
jgi:hypothetical protein